MGHSQGCKRLYEGTHDKGCKKYGSQGCVYCPTTSPFVAKLGANNGVKAATYTFRKAFSSAKSGSFSSIMISECKKHGMKPVCEHPSFCKNDKAGLYIGQDSYISYPELRQKIRNPSGFDKIQSNWNGVCVYTAGSPERLSSGGKRNRRDYARCNVPMWRHMPTWKRPRDWYTAMGFMCGKVGGTAGGRHTSLPHDLPPSLPSSRPPS